uniref:S1 motif domain-containing protein n=1 Tax=Erythrolobus madagascarensis TaxID=708628 RepID=A0A7S0XIV4_9RHOD|mmetsp:Transcript_2529/g.5660  ORF Transcript_2529/g.5660 Transcript_2529/m.5660 type:complete len:320 (+) Transcript_2529:28-987(+)
MAFVGGFGGCGGRAGSVLIRRTGGKVLCAQRARCMVVPVVMMCEEAEGGAASEPEEVVAVDAKEEETKVPKKLKTKITLEELEPGMELEGLVRTVTNYGAFVDVGSSTDGLLHVSQMSSSFVQNVGDIVKVGDKLPVRIRAVDREKGNFALTLLTKEQEEAAGQSSGAGSASRISWADYEQPNEKQFVDGKVVSITQFGAFVDVGAPTDGMVHISALKDERVESVESVLSVGDAVKVRVTGIDRERNRIALSMIEWKESPPKQEGDQPQQQRRGRRQEEEIDVEGRASKEEIASFLEGQPELKTSFQLAWERAQAKTAA